MMNWFVMWLSASETPQTHSSLLIGFHQNSKNNSVWAVDLQYKPSLWFFPPYSIELIYLKVQYFYFQVWCQAVQDSRLTQLLFCSVVIHSFFSGKNANGLGGPSRWATIQCMCIKDNPKERGCQPKYCKGNWEHSTWTWSVRLPNLSHLISHSQNVPVKTITHPPTLPCSMSIHMCSI